MPDAMREIAAGAWLGQPDQLEPATLRIRGAYAGLEGLYGEARQPTTGDARFDGHVDRLLGPDDAMLVVGKLTLADVLRRLLRR